MNIEVIIPLPCNHLEPDAEVFRFRKEIKVCRAVRSLRTGAAHPFHGPQRLKFRHSQKGIAKLVDFLAQMRFEFTFTALEPGAKPLASIIVGTEIGRLADRMLYITVGKPFFRSHKYALKGTGGNQCGARQRKHSDPLTGNSVPLPQRKRFSNRVPQRLIHAARLTDIHICVTAHRIH